MVPIEAAIAARAARAGVQLAPASARHLSRYVELLTRWNRRLNLTSLPLEPLADETIDRLIVESLQAAELWSNNPVTSGVDVGHSRARTLAVDLGSGGGSPAIPLKTVCPSLSFVLVESRGRKCAFLREAVRTLALTGVQVAEARFEQLAVSRPDLAGAADLVTIRAVTPDWGLVGWLLKPKPTSRVFWFGGRAEELPRGYHAERFGAGIILSMRKPA